MLNKDFQNNMVKLLIKFSLKKALLICFIFILGIVVGWFIKETGLNNSDNKLTNLREKGYEYISPLLDVEPRELTDRKDLIVFEKDLNVQINNMINNSKQHISHISVYYKEFSSGAWIGINEKEGFSPASLLKVPLMIAYYKVAESNPSYLKIRIEYQPINVDVSQNIITTIKPLIKGEFYSLEELINKMIIDSDNQAFYLLYKYLRQQDQKKPI